MTDTLWNIFFVVLFLVGMLMYFLPTIVAVKTNHQQAVGIMIVNAFLGWTIIGWVLAFAWAFVKPTTEMRK